MLITGPDRANFSVSNSGMARRYRTRWRGLGPSAVRSPDVAPVHLRHQRAEGEDGSQKAQTVASHGGRAQVRGARRDGVSVVRAGCPRCHGWNAPRPAARRRLLRHAGPGSGRPPRSRCAGAPVAPMRAGTSSFPQARTPGPRCARRWRPGAPDDTCRTSCATSCWRSCGDRPIRPGGANLHQPDRRCAVRADGPRSPSSATTASAHRRRARTSHSSGGSGNSSSSATPVPRRRLAGPAGQPTVRRGCGARGARVETGPGAAAPATETAPRLRRSGAPRGGRAGRAACVVG